MHNPGDIFTEPSNIDVNTLKNLGPLSEMAGIWEGRLAWGVQVWRRKKTGMTLSGARR